MATTLTLKNIPNEVYERLKASAEVHRRSLNSEAIICLESALLHKRISTEDRIARARSLRAAMPAASYRIEDIDSLKREGRA